MKTVVVYPPMYGIEKFLVGLVVGSGKERPAARVAMDFSQRHLTLCRFDEQRADEFR